MSAGNREPFVQDHQRLDVLRDRDRAAAREAMTHLTRARHAAESLFGACPGAEGEDARFALALLQDIEAAHAALACITRR
jgi:hypothetical protein